MPHHPSTWGTTCGLFIDLPPADVIEPGMTIVTEAGAAYLVQSAYRMRSRHPNRWRMRVARIDPATVAEPDVTLRWYRRG